MKISGTEIASRSTQTSGRLLVSVCAAIIFINFYGLNDQPWELFSRRIPTRAYVETGYVILALLGLNFLANWWFDHVSYIEWFRSSKHSLGSTYGLGGVDDTISPLDNLHRRVEAFNKVAEKMMEEADGAISEIVKQLDVKNGGGPDLGGDAKDYIELTVKGNINKVHSSIDKSIGEIKNVKLVLDDIPNSFRRLSLAGFLYLYILNFIFPVSIWILAVVTF
ncbi:hypothetical protein [Oceanibium sediminis]|uniref:hypothetical protein n=1 Tax=Oceanibium sediminis TaxID=2026339 RepID=UPI0013008367|nr:hypothetical protein [Oceanibium sediminis]